MRKRISYLMLLVVVLIGVSIAFNRRGQGPEYGGKKLSAWVDAYFDPDEGQHALDIIRRIGTNGLPYLVKWMPYDPPAWKTTLYNFANPIIRHVNAAWQLTDERNRKRALGAMMAFSSMGTNARPAMPFLRQLLNDSNATVRLAAWTLVRDIEPEALERGNP